MRAWCNGKMVDPLAPALPILDHGITVGDGVFETVKIVDNTPFALTRHLRRLTHSAVGLGLVEPDLDEVRTAIKLTMADQELTFGRMRITYTAGIAPLGSPRAAGAAPSLIVAAEPANPPGPETAAVTVPWPRNERGAVAGLKTTSYAENAVAVAYAGERGASEALFPNTVGNICEGTGSNVFCVIDGAVLTPPLTAGCLAGVTRALVLEWSDAEERDISTADFAAADEVFITSTTRDVQRVSALDGRKLPAQTPLTDAVAAEFAARSKDDVDP
ncbi:MAG: aminotransferase class IV [Nocardioidaceae bacterium]